MARKAFIPTITRERFTVNLAPNIARQLRAAAHKDDISISQYLESSLLEALVKSRQFDEKGMLHLTIGEQKK